MPFPKPEPVARTKRRRQRQEAAVIRDVRVKVFERDGGCRLDSRADSRYPWGRDYLDAASRTLILACAGPLTLAHWGRWRRARTRRQPPMERHTTAGALCLCLAHHQRYDAHEFDILAMTDMGCDGPLAFSAPSENGEER